ncbi:hypothetical protein FRC10_002581, partial [Ceratobasidium sp. 414]
MSSTGCVFGATVKNIGQFTGSSTSSLKISTIGARMSTSTSTSVQDPNQNQKRKAEVNLAVQPEPLSKRAKSSGKAVDEITSHRYEELTNESERATWLRAALENLGVSDFDDETPVIDLKDLYDETLKDPEAGFDDALQGSVGVHVGATTTTEPATKPAAKLSRQLTSTDHMSTGFMWTFGKVPRDSNGKQDMSAINRDDQRSGSSNVPPIPSTTEQPDSTTASSSSRKISKSAFNDLRQKAINQAQRRANSSASQQPTATPRSQPANNKLVGQGGVSTPQHPPQAPVRSTAMTSSIAPDARRTTIHNPRNNQTRGGNGNGTAASSTAPARSHHTSAGSSRTPAQPTSTSHDAHPPRRHVHVNPVEPEEPIALDEPDEPLPPAVLPSNEHGDQGDVEQPIEDDNDDATDPKDGLTKRQRAQLRRFGEATPVVKTAAEIIQLRVLVEHAFPEFEPSPDQGKDGNPAKWTLFDDW